MSSDPGNTGSDDPGGGGPDDQEEKKTRFVPRPDLAKPAAPAADDASPEDPGADAYASAPGPVIGRTRLIGSQSQAGGGVQETTPAMRMGSGAKTQLIRGGDSDSESDPVAGWVVVVKGPGRGSFSAVYVGMNAVGRDSSQRVSLNFGDESISREEHAFITYDDALPILLDRVEQDLRQQYFARGYYAVIVRPTITPLERNRVDINIEVIEGGIARIHEINIVGNRLFGDKQLRKLFSLGPKPWYALFSSRDKYSKQKLSGDLERLRNFYQDQGFLEFNIESTQVSITPDKERIYITVNISEGKKYTISGYKLAGVFVVPEKEINDLIGIKSGRVFSRKDITEISKRITDRLANNGYAFANVNPIPDVDKENSQVFFTFFVDPGRRIYVRRVNFSGNVATTDEVIRREMRQQESAWYNASKIQRSRIRLQRLGFFDDVNVETPAVPGVPDQVDVNMTVKERPTGNLLLGVGFSDTDGLLLNARVTQSNLFGTGKELSVGIDNTRSTTNFNIRYINPYYTKSGVSRGFNFFSSTVDAAEADTAAYTVDSRGLGIFYGIPLSEDNKIDIGFDVERIDLKTNSTSAQIAQDFVAKNGPSNTVLKTTLGWSYDTLDSLLVPTSGSIQRITAEITLPGSEIDYYKLTYTAGRYWPLSETLTFKAKAELGYGDGFGNNDSLPFYKNFFAGGSSTVRGYRSRSLGPRDTLPPNDPIGGNRRILANMELLFPLPGATVENKAMRLSLFTDAGTVYGPGEKLDLGQLRYSAGLAFNWYSPVGPLAVSYAVPISKKAGDRTEAVQLTLGIPLR